MSDDSSAKVSEKSMATTEATASRQRKKRKWDQPAESLVSAGFAVHGLHPVGNVGSIVGITLPGMAPLSGALLTSTLPSTCANMPQVLQAPALQQAAAVVQKLNQSKIQDELIAREIVINDAEATVRYKLTKRQTQEEIQKCTGAVVITRGKYRPPNSVPDNEKPLYLHISAGAHLKETAERIKAVDCAAAMVEEMLKQGLKSQLASTPFHGQLVTQPLTTCVFLGFDVDPSLNIAARIRGPNDQYINHIMNETGVSVLLRGRGSGNVESTHGEELQPLHLYLSSNNPKSLEDARLLAENLLDTISVECGASRASSCKVYNAVPPPQQLLAGVQNSGNEPIVNATSVASLTSAVGSALAPLVSPATVPATSGFFPQGSVSPPGELLNYGQPQPNTVCFPQTSLKAGTSYSGYGGIYPQATPLQQVALALRQSSSPVTSSVPSTTLVQSTLTKATSSSIPEKEKRPTQKRKFQELPVASKEHTNQNLLQGPEMLQLTLSKELGVRNTHTMPAPKKLVEPLLSGMLPPPPRTMPPPPPPPKFTSPTSHPKANGENKKLIKSKPDNVPDTLIKLMEYGEDDDDPEGTGEESPRGNLSSTGPRKPFWAL